MSTKFRANTGTLPNASGLPQIPAGSNRIPQGFLNGIGRKIDQGTVRFSGDFLFQQLQGGTVLQNIDTAGTAALGGGSSHPFKVTVVGKGNGKIQVRIAEGHIIGRTEFSHGSYQNPLIGLYNQPTLGLPGVDFAFNGGWPDGNPAPDTSAGTNATSSGTQSGDSKPGSGGTFHTPLASGNSGSITNPGQSSGTYHTPIQSGNSGSVTNTSQGNSGIYHSDPSTVYNQIYDKSYDQLGNGGGTFVNPPK
jgi:hypothetical protein